MFGYSIFGILIYLELPNLIALCLATIVGVGFNYVVVGSFVFQAKLQSKKNILKFIISYSVVYCVNAASLEYIIYKFGLSPYLAQAVCIPFCVFLSWVLLAYWVFIKEGNLLDKEIN